MKRFVTGQTIDAETFQDIFLPSEPTTPPTNPIHSTSPQPSLTVDQNWLSFFRKAKEKLLQEQNQEDHTTNNHLYDNNRKQITKKWWKEKHNQAPKSNKTNQNTTNTTSSEIKATDTPNKPKKTAGDIEHEQLEASLAAQFDEEVSRTSARFYPALPLRTDTSTVSKPQQQEQQEEEEEEEMKDKEMKAKETKDKDISVPNTQSKKSKRKKTKNKGTKGGGVFSSNELSKRYESIVWGDVFDGSCTADCLFVRSAIIRKDLLHTFDPEAAIVPKTHVVQSVQDVIDAVAHSNNDNNNNTTTTTNNNKDTTTSNNSCNNIWVIKPPDSSNAFGISFFSAVNVEQISMSLFPSNHSSSTKYVIQKYISPYITNTIQKRKFHLRQMMLCVGGSMNAIDLWLYDDVRVLIATNEWSPNNWENRHTHITNGSVNRDANGYIEAKQNVSMEEVWISKEDVVACKALRVQMTKDIITLMKSVHVKAKKSAFMTLPGTYELFGIDWAIDAFGKGWILEINPEPSMKVYPHLKGGRPEMIGTGPWSVQGSGTEDNGLPAGWNNVWSSKMLDAMRRLRGRR